MEIKRRILTQGIIVNNEIIPIWDDRIEFRKTEMFGNSLYLEGDNVEKFNIVECIYDIKTKKVFTGVELNRYPDEDKLEFKKGDNILVEVSGRKLREAQIKDIVYEDYDIYINKGSKVDRFTTKYFTDVDFIPSELYAIKNWKPYYILDDGTKIEWEHQMYHKV
jgi:hypothetical protein